MDRICLPAGLSVFLLVSQLPIICFGIQLNYSNGSVQLHLQF